MQKESGNERGVTRIGGPVEIGDKVPQGQLGNLQGESGAGAGVSQGNQGLGGQYGGWDKKNAPYSSNFSTKGGDQDTSGLGSGGLKGDNAQ